MIRRIAVLMLVAGAALALAAGALAKGPSKASLAGPGLQAALVFGGSGEDGGSSPLGRLTQDAGFFPAVFGQEPNPMLAGRPARDLGPRYTITYTVPGPSGTNDVIQDVYPYARGGAVTYMKPGQRVFGGVERTRGGWFAAAPGLKPTLIDAGLPRNAPVSIGTLPGGGNQAADDGDPWPYLVGVGIAFALLVTAAVVIAKRRVRPAPAR